MERETGLLPVMTYNIRIDIGINAGNAWDRRAARIASVIRRFKPAIVGTQEGNERMLADLLRLLPEYSLCGQGRMGGNADEYCAILYRHERFEAVEDGQFWLSETPDEPGSSSWESSYPRICTWVRLQSDGNPDKQLVVYNTHLDHISQEAREQGALLIAEKLRRYIGDLGLPFVLMGDFNATPSNPVIRFLRGAGRISDTSMPLIVKDAFESVGKEAGLTFHNFEGGEAGEPIDYIFTSDSMQSQDAVVFREKVDGQFPSDHYPATAWLNW